MHIQERTTCILVISAGHVLVGRAEGGEDGTVRLYDARTIRTWGTDRGLGQLFSGPLKSTVLDAQVPLILVPVAQIIYALPVQDTPAWWA